MNNAEKMFLKPEHRNALEAAETLKAYCAERSEYGRNCKNCIFYNEHIDCLLMTDELTERPFDPAPACWRLDLCK